MADDVTNTLRFRALELAIRSSPGATPTDLTSVADQFERYLRGAPAAAEPAPKAAAAAAAAAPATKPAPQKPAAKQTAAKPAKPAAAAQQRTAPTAGAKPPDLAQKDLAEAIKPVVAALGGDAAYKILAQHGGGVRSIRDVKPADYPKVIAACKVALAAAVTDATPQDDFGVPVGEEVPDPDADLPEGGSGELE